MTTFETSGSVAIEIDQGSLRDAREEIEESIGSVTVGVSGTAGGAGGGAGMRADGGARGPLRRLRTLTQDSLSLAEDRNDLLADLLDEIEDGEGGLGGGGGGGGLPGLGGGGGGGGNGLLAGAGGGLLAKLGLGGTLGTSALFGGGALAGAGLGLGGVNLLDRSGALDAVEDLGNLRGNLPGGDLAGDIQQAQGLQYYAALADLSRGDVEGARETTQDAADQQQDAISGLIDRTQSVGGVAVSASDAVSQVLPSDRSADSAGTLLDAVTGGGGRGGGGGGDGGRGGGGGGPQLPGMARSVVGAADTGAVVRSATSGLPGAAEAVLGAAGSGNGGSGGGGGGSGGEANVQVEQTFRVEAGGSNRRDIEQQVRETARREGERTKREVQRDLERGVRGPGGERP